jgi:4-diphosphocytidyl-2-C-methyl-D-erythritol kinase
VGAGVPGVRLCEFAPAKVNLFLHLVGKRAGGYHLLDSLVVFADVGDRLSAVPAAGFSLAVEGPFAGALEGASDNLVLRAARLLAEHCGVGPALALTLEKRLPVAGGIGGGSADAAAALRLLGRAWGVAPGELERFAGQLGADVPVCLAGVPARMSGIGEKLAAAPALPEFGLVLVNPGVGLSTAEVFGARSGVFSEPADLPLGWTDTAGMTAVLAALRNDLEEPAIRLCPVIGQVLRRIAQLPGCLLARMSGSGSTCFGLFGDAAAARAAVRELSCGDWWVWGGETGLNSEGRVFTVVREGPTG